MCGGIAYRELGIVDSGADSTLLPKTAAAVLGLDENHDLIETPDGSEAAGGLKFPTWTAPNHQFTCQVIANLPSGETLWGPVVDLTPSFAEDAVALFGRADFFAAFSITFEEDATHGPVFHLDY
jgi:hypothetical protein